MPASSTPSPLAFANLILNVAAWAGVILLVVYLSRKALHWLKK